MIATFAFVVVIVGVIVTQLFWEKRRRAEFEEQFPPISDEEFMALCDPGTNPAIALKVRRIISDQLGVEYERIYPSSSFVNDLGAE